MNSFSKARLIIRPSVRLSLVLLLLTAFAARASGRGDHVNLFPKLRAGQTLSYEISYHSYKQVKSESSVVAANAPDSEEVNVRGVLRLEILSVAPQGDRALIHGRTRFDALNEPHSKPSKAEAPQCDNTNGKAVDFSILPDGRFDQIAGLDDLSREQQQAWHEWASRFALATALPANGVRMAQKWKSEEAERSPMPIARLIWLRESTYVRDEPCRSVRMTDQGELADGDTEPETCAVILTTAVLKQQSNPQNATPEDFKLHELRTSGTARGTNHIITYVSLKTGLIIRATEEANQHMDVTLAKTDSSNRVRYAVNASSHSEILLVSDTPTR